MPLPVPTVARSLTHTRRLRFEAYKSADGLWDIEAHLTDVKPFDYQLSSGVRPAGTPVHDMWIRLTINLDLEIVDALGTAPDVHSLPVGNAGNITAYWKGYTEYHRDGLTDKLPRMLGTQAAGAAPLVLGHPVSHPETIATAIRIGSPASWGPAMAAQQESDGQFLAATDDEILAAYHLVARDEGVFVEPASAASIAGLLKAVEDGWVKPGSTVVCTVTGNGLKDPDTALRDMPKVTPLPVDPGAVVAELGLG